MAAARRWLGRNAHAWMYDFAALKLLLQEAGFADVRRCELGDCLDPMFALVEVEGRFSDSGERELALEAVKSDPAVDRPRPNDRPA